jgi:hypothetical protein
MVINSLWANPLPRRRLFCALAVAAAGTPRPAASDAAAQAQPTETRMLTLADRRSLLDLDPDQLPQPVVVFMAGYRSIGDGGGGIFSWLPQRTDMPDDVLVMQTPRTPQGRWVRNWSGGRISPEMAGAVGDGAADDHPAFRRLVTASRVRGAFTIALTAGKHYYIAQMLDLSIGAPGLTIEGPAAAQNVPDRATDPLIARIELEPANGSTIKLGDSQAVRNVQVWRHGLVQDPDSLAVVRAEVARWFSEDGGTKPRTIGLLAPFTDVTIEGVALVGFHTGILVSGGRYKIRHCLIDTAGHAVEATGSKDTSLIEDVQARGLWSFRTPGSDALGDQSYRPGTAFYIHDSSDGLQLNSVMSIAWANGIWLHGSAKANDWLISVFQPNVETPANAGKPTAAIRTTGDVRRITIIDPRLVFGGNGNGPSAGFDFGHNDPNPAAAANNNVTVIGGTVEVANQQGIAVLARAGSNGSMTETTLAGPGLEPLVKILPNSGHWEFYHLQLRGPAGRGWLSVDPDSEARVTVDGQAVRVARDSQPAKPPPRHGTE